MSKARVKRLEQYIDELELAAADFCRLTCRVQAQDGVGKGPECAACQLAQYVEPDDDDDEPGVDPGQQAREAMQRMQEQGAKTFASDSQHRRVGPGNLIPGSE